MAPLNYSKPRPMEDAALDIQLLEKSTHTRQIEEHEMKIWIVKDTSSGFEQLYHSAAITDKSFMI